MPVYIRKDQLNFSISPSSEQGFNDEENCFITDPEQFADALPQPYRMIDYFLSQCLDQTWSEIVKREHERKLEQEIVRPNISNKFSIYENFDNIKCICSLSSSNHVVLGLSNGIALVQLAPDETNSCELHFELIDLYEDESFDLVWIKRLEVADEISVLFTCDENGSSRIIVVLSDRFYMLKTLNDIEKKVFVHHIEVSPFRDVIAVYSENSSSNVTDFSVECYKLPIEVWKKELSAWLQNRRDALAKQSMPTNVAVVPTIEENSLDDNAEQQTFDSAAQSSNSKLAELEDRNNLKCSQITLLFKFRKFPDLTATSLPNFQSVLKHLPDMECLGSGGPPIHLFNKSYFELKQKFFDLMHPETEGLVTVLPNAETKEKSNAEIQKLPLFTFLRAGLLNNASLDQMGPEKETGSLAVAWPDSNYLYFYTVYKSPNKEFISKPDIFRTFSTTISCISSAEANLPDDFSNLETENQTTKEYHEIVAIGLEDGQIILMDNKFGLTQSLFFGSIHSIQHLYFTENIIVKSVTSKSDNKKSVNKFASCFKPDWPIKMVIVDKKYNLFSVDIDRNQQSHEILTRKTKSSIYHQSDWPIFTQTIKELPNLMIRVNEDGTIILNKITSPNEVDLVQLEIPETLKLDTPWSPEIQLSNQKILNLKVVQETNELDEFGLPIRKTFLISHNLEANLNMQPYLNEISKAKQSINEILQHKTVNQTSEIFANLILEDWFANHKNRQENIQSAWNELENFITSNA